MHSSGKTPLIRLAKRDGMAGAGQWGIRIAAILLALVVGGLVILLSGNNPIQGYSIIVEGALGKTSGIRQTVKNFIPLLGTALAIAPCFKMRFWNIGAEGQITAGAMCATYFALFWADSIPQVPLLLLMCAAGAIAGVTAGSLLSLTVLTVFLLRRRDRAAVDVPPARSAVLRELLTVGIPITLGAAGMSLITLLDQALVMSTLQNTLGYTEAAATALYGEYTFGMTLFALPPSFIYPVTVSLVPDISAALARSDRPAAGRSAAAALKLTTLIALPTGAGLSVLAGPILRLLYPAVPDTAAAAAYHLTILGIACIFVCLMVATNGVLQAYGKEYFPVVSVLWGGFLKIITIYLMVGDPATYVRGGPLSTLYCYGLIVVLNLIAIARCVPERPSYLRLFARPVLITAVMALAARSSYGLLSRSLPERWAVLPAIAVAVVVYGVLVLALGAVTRQDVLDLPKGEKIARMLHLH